MTPKYTNRHSFFRTTLYNRASNPFAEITQKITIMFQSVVFLLLSTVIQAHGGATEQTLTTPANSTDIASASKVSVDVPSPFTPWSAVGMTFIPMVTHLISS